MSQALRNSSTNFEIRKINNKDIEAVTRFFIDVVRAGMEQTFHPHPFDLQTAQRICSHDGFDWYAGCFVGNENDEHMIGYVMLRGWDEGYSIPSFGICILPNYQGCGLGRTLLNLSILVARFRGSPAIRLKVYPDNKAALALYQSTGFEFLENLEHGQMVGYLKLKTIDIPTGSHN
jgi:ribosomal protein S18 acetylase RimI-like enzyme